MEVILSVVIDLFYHSAICNFVMRKSAKDYRSFHCTSGRYDALRLQTSYLCDERDQQEGLLVSRKFTFKKRTFTWRSV